MKHIKLILAATCVATALQAVTPLPVDRKITPKESEIIAAEVIRLLTEQAQAASAPVTAADTIAANDTVIAQASSAFADKERKRKERELELQKEYAASLVRVADIADAKPEVSMHSVTTANIADVQPDTQVVAMPSAAHLRQAATVVVADIADAPVTAQYIEPELQVGARAHDATYLQELWDGYEVRQVNRPEIYAAIERARFEDPRAHDKVQMQELWDAHEVRAVNRPELYAVIEAERAKIAVSKQAALESLTGFDYYWQKYATLHNQQRVTTAVGVGLGVLALYAAYRGITWAYSAWYPAKQAKKQAKKARFGKKRVVRVDKGA